MAAMRLMRLEQRRQMVETYVNGSEFAEPRQYFPFSRGTSLYDSKPFAPIFARTLSVGDGSTASLSPVFESRQV